MVINLFYCHKLQEIIVPVFIGTWVNLQQQSASTNLNHTSVTAFETDDADLQYVLSQMYVHWQTAASKLSTHSPSATFMIWTT